MQRPSLDEPVAVLMTSRARAGWELDFIKPRSFCKSQMNRWSVFKAQLPSHFCLNTQWYYALNLGSARYDLAAWHILSRTARAKWRHCRFCIVAQF